MAPFIFALLAYWMSDHNAGWVLFWCFIGCLLSYHD